MPAVLFASRADRYSALSVMWPIITDFVVIRQIAPLQRLRPFRYVTDCSACSVGIGDWVIAVIWRCPGRRVAGPAYPVRMTELRFTKETDASRYTLHRGDDLVSVLDYRDDGRTVAMTRAYTVPTFRGHGYAGELVERAVAELEQRGDREVVPVCWYVADWFEANPSRLGILSSRS